MSFEQTRREFLKLAGTAGVGSVLSVTGVVDSHSVPADLILRNGRFHTLRKQKPLASARGHT